MGHDQPLAQQLKTIRKQWGLSQADLAEILGIGERTLCYWEATAGHDVTLDKLVRWADALGYDVKLELRKSRNGRTCA